VSALGPRAGGLRLIRLVLVAVAVATVLNTGGMVALFLLNGDRVSQIQEERADNILRSCEDTNARYRTAVRELDRLLAVRTRDMTVTQRRAVEQSRASTVVLIAAIVPPRRCAEIVREQVNTG
jgi:hypothetical protein